MNSSTISNELQTSDISEQNSACTRQYVFMHWNFGWIFVCVLSAAFARDWWICIFVCSYYYYYVVHIVTFISVIKDSFAMKFAMFNCWTVRSVCNLAIILPRSCKISQDLGKILVKSCKIMRNLGKILPRSLPGSWQDLSKILPDMLPEFQQSMFPCVWAGQLQDPRVDLFLVILRQTRGLWGMGMGKAPLQANVTKLSEWKTSL